MKYPLSAPRKAPNILWICTDQQRFDTLGCYGNSWVKTPNLDRLAARGTLFENAFCQNPLCTPSRASFLTGRYPRTTRARQNGQSIPPMKCCCHGFFRAKVIRAAWLENFIFRFARRTSAPTWSDASTTATKSFTGSGV